jgi:hypothetical protein
VHLSDSDHIYRVIGEEYFDVLLRSVGLFICADLMWVFNRQEARSSISSCFFLKLGCHTNVLLGHIKELVLSGSQIGVERCIVSCLVVDLRF